MVASGLIGIIQVSWSMIEVYDLGFRVMVWNIIEKISRGIL